MATYLPWEHLVVTLDYSKQPDFAGLGNDGWEFVQSWESTVPPDTQAGAPPFQGRTYVFKRQAVTAR